MPEFSDAQLIVILQKSARRINRKLCLTGTDEQIIVNTVTGDITPDDDDLKDLVLLQAECLIAQRHFTDLLATDNEAAGVVIKDGEQTIDTTSGMSVKASLLNSDSPNSPCAELEEAIKSEKLNRVGDNGSMVW
jgi:hypothetical protein